jgi:uncharacterized integral membrane protein
MNHANLIVCRVFSVVVWVWLIGSIVALVLLTLLAAIKQDGASLEKVWAFWFPQVLPALSGVVLADVAERLRRAYPDRQD